MRPPQPLEAAVVINIRIGKLVVVSVQAYPINWAVLAADCTTGGEKPLEPMGYSEGPMAQ
jgi:hypothetical protein